MEVSGWARRAGGPRHRRLVRSRTVPDDNRGLCSTRPSPPPFPHRRQATSAGWSRGAEADARLEASRIFDSCRHDLLYDTPEARRQGGPAEGIQEGIPPVENIRAASSPNGIPPSPRRKLRVDAPSPHPSSSRGRPFSNRATTNVVWRGGRARNLAGGTSAHRQLPKRPRWDSRFWVRGRDVPAVRLHGWGKWYKMNISEVPTKLFVFKYVFSCVQSKVHALACFTNACKHSALPRCPLQATTPSREERRPPSCGMAVAQDFCERVPVSTVGRDVIPTDNSITTSSGGYSTSTFLAETVSSASLSTESASLFEETWSEVDDTCDHASIASASPFDRRSDWAREKAVPAAMEQEDDQDAWHTGDVAAVHERQPAIGHKVVHGLVEDARTFANMLTRLAEGQV